MKAFLSTISLSLSFIVIGACMFLGMRIGPTLWRGIVVFVLVYLGGLIAVTIIFVNKLSTSGHGGGPPISTSKREEEKPQVVNEVEESPSK